MAITMKTCKEESDYAQYMKFFLTNRHFIQPVYPVKFVVELMAVQVLHGHIIMGMDEQGQVVGATAYYFGTPDRDFVNRDQVYIEITLMNESFRGTTAFMQGFLYLVEEIERSGLPVREVLFFANSGSDYLRKLYSKFSNTVAHQTLNGVEQDVYLIPFDRFAAYIRTFDRRLRR